MENDKLDIWGPDFAQLLLESMADGVFTLDDKGKITSWNRSMEIITGYLSDEAVGKGCSLLQFNRCFGKSCPAGINECEIFKHGRIDKKECHLRHKNGENVPVLKSARLVKDKKGAVIGVVETVTDLSKLQEARKKAEEANLRLGQVHQFHNIIGKSSEMNQVFHAINAAGASDASVLIFGESGTGKELVAGAIHTASNRAPRPYLSVNCSALSESLLESELFGHVKGAFTGATKDRMGRFEEAEGGTLFLDEISEISPGLQVKLLRVLQEREIERVGESKKRKIDIRLIAATNQDLFALVKNREFREDLYYRLKVFPIALPSLRNRKKDIPLLVSHFMALQNKKTGKKITGVTQPAMRILMDHDWPGNVRELENAIEHGFVLCNTSSIDTFDLPVEIRQRNYTPGFTQEKSHGHKSGEMPVRQTGKKLDKDTLLDLLHQAGWNKAEVARQTGLSRASIWKYMKKWDIPNQMPDAGE